MPFEQHNPKTKFCCLKNKTDYIYILQFQLKIDKLLLGQFVFAYIAVWPLSLSTADKIIWPPLEIWIFSCQSSWSFKETLKNQSRFVECHGKRDRNRVSSIRVEKYWFHLKSSECGKGIIEMCYFCHCIWAYAHHDDLLLD